MREIAHAEGDCAKGDCADGAESRVVPTGHAEGDCGDETESRVAIWL